MDFSIIQSPEVCAAFLPRIIEAADDHKRELGFLPPAAYAAQIDKGRLWVLTDLDRDYVGHLMFSGHQQCLKVTQLFVIPRARRHGLGTLAIETLKKYACDLALQYIQARVAADLPANKVWAKFGFNIMRQVKGGESTRRLINERAWFVPSAALFETTSSESQLSVMHARSISKLSSYVLDTNVVIDYSRMRSEYQDVEILLKKTLGQEFILRSTPELETELSRGMSFSETDATVRLARLIPALSPIELEVTDKRIAELIPIVFPSRTSVSDLKPNEKSDLIHLAYCIEYEQDGFITRDGPLLRAGNKIGIKYGVEILTPHDLAPSNMAPVDHTYSDSLSNRFSFLWIPGAQIKPIVSKSFPKKLQSYIASVYPDWKSRSHHDAKLLAITHLGNDVGYALLLWNAGNNSWDIALSPLQSLQIGRGLIDELLHNVYGLCRPSHSTPLSLVLAGESLDVYQQALAYGFAICEPQQHPSSILRLVRLVHRGIVTPVEWPELVSAIRRTFDWNLTDRVPTYGEFLNTGIRIDLNRREPVNTFVKLADFEKLIAPGILLLGGRPAALVPIRREFAKQLLPEIEVTRDMIDGMYAGMYEERAYFSYSKTQLPIASGAVVVFYVSGQGPESGMAAAIATVTSVTVTTENEARRNYLSRGVLELKETDKQVTVVTFSNITALKRPIPYNWMKQKGIIGGANLVTAQEITGNQLRAILNYSES